MRKILSVVLASVMLLSCLGLSIAADEVFTTTAAPEGEWYVFEETIVSEVLSNGNGKYRFADTDPRYKGFDTAGNVLALDRRAANITAEAVKTDENGTLYADGDGCWQGRDSDNGFFVYQYGIAQGATKMLWTATVGGQYGVYVWVGGATPEADATKWVQLAVHEGDGKVKECNYLTLEADLTQFEGYDKATNLYIKINDEDPSDGWGGRIALGLNYPITLSYDVDAPAVEEDPSAGDEPIVDGEGKLHEKHVFTVATSEERAHLYEDTGATNKSGIHYADSDRCFTYMYTIENNVKMTSVTWSAPIGQQLYLQVSSDGITWTDVYKWDGTTNEDGSGGLPFVYTTYDLTSLLALPTSTVFIKIADSHPDGGWGGAIDSSMPVILDVTYEELTEEEKAAAEAEKAAQEAARLEAEKAAAKAEAQSVVDQLGTLAGYTVDDLNEDNYKEIFKEIRNAKRAYNDLSEQAKEAADEAGAQAMLEAAEKLKADYEAILEAKENEPTTEDPEPTTPEIPDEPDTPDTPDEPEQPADEGGLSPVVIVVIAVVVVAAVVVVVVIATKKKK